MIDAIEFALTGSISRLMGRGTKGLSVAEHGPHVDKMRFPDAAFVRVKVFLTDLGKPATVTRKLKTQQMIPNSALYVLSGTEKKCDCVRCTE